MARLLTDGERIVGRGSKIFYRKVGPFGVTEILVFDEEHPAQDPLIELLLDEIARQKLNVSCWQSRCNEVENRMIALAHANLSLWRSVRNKSEELGWLNGTITGLKAQLELRPTWTEYFDIKRQLSAIRIELAGRPTWDQYNELKRQLVDRPFKWEYDQLRAELVNRPTQEIYDDLFNSRVARSVYDVAAKLRDDFRIENWRLRKENAELKLKLTPWRVALRNSFFNALGLLLSLGAALAVFAFCLWVALLMADLNRPRADLEPRNPYSQLEERRLPDISQFPYDTGAGLSDSALCYYLGRCVNPRSYLPLVGSPSLTNLTTIQHTQLFTDDGQLSDMSVANLPWTSPMGVDGGAKTIDVSGWPYSPIGTRRLHFRSLTSIVVVDFDPANCNWRSWRNLRADESGKFVLAAVRTDNNTLTGKILGIYLIPSQPENGLLCSPLKPFVYGRKGGR